MWAGPNLLLRSPPNDRQAVALEDRMHLLEILNPVAPQRAMQSALQPNPRPKSLDGKTVGLVWSGTHGGDVALKTAGEELQKRFKNVRVNFYTGGNYPNPPHILKQAGEECDVVIGATAD